VFLPVFTGAGRFGRCSEIFDSVLVFLGALLGARRRRILSDQVKFSAVQEFPLHLLARFQTNGCGKGDWEIDVEFGFLSFGPNGLHF
jgi:hypothetical protein